MNVSISIDPAEMEFPNGDRYSEPALLEALREFIDARLGKLANVTTLQIGHRQGDAWAKIDGDSEAGEALLRDFFEDHATEEELFEPLPPSRERLEALRADVVARGCPVSLESDLRAWVAVIDAAIGGDAKALVEVADAIRDIRD